MTDIPTGVKLTAYSGGSNDITPRVLQGFGGAVAAGRFELPIGAVFPVEELVEAHRLMDSNRSADAIVDQWLRGALASPG